ncbi:MAG: type III-A CRISPR-associated protein Cas10/Csm1 [bacterium]
MSIGDPRLGVLKMDVDYLGLIFEIGFDKEEGESDESISRISTLSRMLDVFFSGYINKICERQFDEWKKKVSDLGNKNAEYIDKISNIFYIVYSGGDDLLILGPWSEMPHLARTICEEFREYTCSNPNITLSGGIFLCKPKFPINRFASLAGGELEKSKGGGRNRITFFQETLEWDRFGDYLEFGERLFEWMSGKDNEEKIGRGFIHQLIEMKRQYIKEGDEVDLNLIPALIYQIARNVKGGWEEGEVKSKLYAELISTRDVTELMKHIEMPAGYALLKSRKG